MDIIAVILRDDVLVEIHDHVGLSSHFPALKPAIGPPSRPAGNWANRSPLPVHLPEDCFSDYSEYDCMDEPPDPEERPDIPRAERKEPKPRKDLLEIVDSFPGKTLCWAS